MSDRSQLPAGVPHLLDQYKQRRQAWLDQADELARLRDEVRLAAEREALDIVTAARRDVRRVVVEARRELLVLTAQLHAAVESVDQAALQHGIEPGADGARRATRLGAFDGSDALGATREAVLGARREVRSVLDEARVEIEALVAEARTPLQDSSLPEPFGPFTSHNALAAELPIPTLEAILGTEAGSRMAAPQPAPVTTATSAPSVVSAPVPFLAEPTEPSAALARLVPEPAAPILPVAPPLVAAPAESFEAAPFATAHDLSEPRLLETVLSAAPSPSIPRWVQPEHDLSTLSVEEPVSYVLAPDSDTLMGGFRKRDSEERQAAALATFGETGPVHAPVRPDAFLDDEDSRPRPMLPWIGMFAATGILILAGAVWWVQQRNTRNTLLTSITTTSPTTANAGGNPEAAAVPSEAPTTPTAATPVTPAGLVVEVRRTAWLRAVVDGKEDSRVYQAGETRNIAGARSVSLRAGDGGAVFVSVDGRPAEALGVAGTAVTRQYSLASPAVVPAVASTTTPSTPTAANAASQGPRPPAAQPPGTDAARGASAARTGESPVAGAPATQVPTPPTPSAAADGNGAAPASSGRADLVSAGQQWLDAYQRRDRDGMSSTGTDNVTISDERTLTERFPAWQTGIRRDLDQVELELTGDTALLTARMTERNGDAGTTSAQHVSRVSQIWVRRNGRWRVADVRIMGEGRLSQIVR